MSSAFRDKCLQGKVALVTGGATGICKEITSTFMSLGADTVILSRKRANLTKTARELQDAYTGRSCLPVVADVRDPSAVEAAVDEALSHYGKIDILINGAAGNFLCPIGGLSYKGFKAVMEIDAHGTFIVSKCVFEKAFSRLSASQQGVIINISATLHYSGTLFQCHAGAAKASVDAMTKHMAVEWGPRGVRVNGVAPGWIEDTEGFSRLAKFGDGDGGDADSFIPLSRLGTKKDIANATVFLALPEASYISGVTLVVDGAQSLACGNVAVAFGGVRERWQNQREIPLSKM